MSRINDEIITDIRRIEFKTPSCYTDINDREFQLGIHLITHNVQKCKVFIMSEEKFDIVKRYDKEKADEIAQKIADKEITNFNFVYVNKKLYIDFYEKDLKNFNITDMPSLMLKSNYKGYNYTSPKVIILIYNNEDDVYNNDLDDDFEIIDLWSGQFKLRRIIFKEYILENSYNLGQKHHNINITFNQFLDQIEISTTKYNNIKSRRQEYPFLCFVMDKDTYESFKENDYIDDKMEFFKKKNLLFKSKKYTIESFEMIDNNLYIDFDREFKLEDFSGFTLAMSSIEENICPSILILVEGDEDE